MMKDKCLEKNCESCEYFIYMEADGVIQPNGLCTYENPTEPPLGKITVIDGTVVEPTHKCQQWTPRAGGAVVIEALVAEGR